MNSKVPSTSHMNPGLFWRHSSDASSLRAASRTNFSRRRVRQATSRARLQPRKELRFLTRAILRAVGFFGRDRETGPTPSAHALRPPTRLDLRSVRLRNITLHARFLASFEKTIRTSPFCVTGLESGADIVWKP